MGLVQRPVHDGPEEELHEEMAVMSSHGGSGSKELQSPVPSTYLTFLRLCDQSDFPLQELPGFLTRKEWAMANPLFQETCAPRGPAWGRFMIVQT